MKGIRLVPNETSIKFIRYGKFSLLASSLAMLASIALFFAFNLNYGIDFRGGTLIEIRDKSGEADIGDLRVRIGGLGLGEVQIQEFGGPSDVLIRIEQQPGGEETQQQAVAAVKGALADTVDYRRVEVVGPTVSGELKTSGAIAVFVAIFAVLLYIWFRFEWQFSIGAVAALVHDVVLTIGIFCALQLEFSLSIIAAILTIVGYSLNDTVVVFDRVRENLRKYKKMPLPELLDLSINETLSRTILTSVTTLIALGSLYILGGEVIRGFTFAMIWGVLVGTYSSIFIAAPLLLRLGVRRDWSGLGGAKVKDPSQRKEKRPPGGPVERPIPGE
jgi:preprotein translocase SecF subunit